MLRPSYTELMNVLNNESDLNSNITSRYIIVIAAAKRARQIIAGENPLVKTNDNKAVSIAVKELYENKLIITESADTTDADRATVDEIFENTSFNE